MSEPLSEDMSKWPDSPFELLEIKGQIDLRSVRRTYTRLIRQFSPEKFPEHFQRIRAAYELVQSILNSSDARDAQMIVLTNPEGSPPASVDKPKPPPAAPLRNSVSANQEPVTEPEPEFPSPGRGEPEEPEVSPSTSQIWQAATNGDWETAYRGLAEAFVRTHDKVEVALQLYWLLTFNPQLDPSRKAWQWLIDGMRHAGVTGRLFEVFCGALEDVPDLSAKCDELLRLETPYGSLRRLCYWRWRRGISSGRWQVIVEDLKELRSRLQNVPPNLWVGLLFQAIDFLAFGDHRESRKNAGYLLSEISSFPELELTMESEHHRAECALALAAERQGITNHPEQLKDIGEINRLIVAILPELWNSPDLELRHQLLEISWLIVQRPRNALSDLDDFVHHVGRQHLHYLSDVLRRLPRPTANPTPPPDDLITSRVQRFLNYELIATRTAGNLERQVADSAIRTEVLEFCLAEWISPSDLANSIEASGSYTQAWEGFPATIRTDASLQLVWSAHYALGVSALAPR